MKEKNLIAPISLGELHFTEIKLLKFIRRKQNGKLFISIKDGLPMSGFISDRQAVRFTHKDGNNENL